MFDQKIKDVKATMYGEALATRRAHPLQVRRYMGKVKH